MSAGPAGRNVASCVVHDNSATRCLGGCDCWPWWHAVKSAAEHAGRPCRKLEAAESRCQQLDQQAAAACRERDEARAGAAKHTSAAAAAAEQQADELRRCAWSDAYTISYINGCSHLNIARRNW